MVIEKLSSLDANDILTRTNLDEVPEEFREEVWVEEDESGEVIENWFVGVGGALSWNGGETLTNERFQLLITHEGE